MKKNKIYLGIIIAMMLVIAIYFSGIFPLAIVTGYLGNTDLGNTNDVFGLTNNDGRIAGILWEYTPSFPGVGGSITVLCGTTGTTGCVDKPMRCAIYDESLNFMAGTEELLVDCNEYWEQEMTFDFVTIPSLTPGESYYILAWMGPMEPYTPGGFHIWDYTLAGEPVPPGMNGMRFSGSYPYVDYSEWPSSLVLGLHYPSYNPLMYMTYTYDDALSANANGPYSGQINVPIQFTGSAIGGSLPYSYAWDFGDTGTSALQNPSHTYTSTGDYTVTLTVTDNVGDTADDVTTASVSQSPPLVADAHGPYSGQTDESIQFTGSSTGGIIPYTYHWDFGDGATSDLQNPIHSYFAVGDYTATLTVTDAVTTTDTDTASVNVWDTNYQRCWRCLDDEPDYYDFEMPVTCGEGTAINYPYDSEPDCTPSTPGFEFIILLSSIFVLFFIYKKRK